MYKYNGRVIYQIHDDDGIMEIVEVDNIRSLHFGSDARQSSISLENKDLLCLAYIRAMMAWQLYRDNFDHALMIGLGGGSLTRHLLQYFNPIKVTVVEQRKQVVKIARTYFSLPFDARLKVITGDGGEYIQQAATGEKRFDLLFIDAFGHDSMASSISGFAFFDACKNILHKQGMMVINLWDTDQVELEQIVLVMSQCFDRQLLFLPVTGKGNIIVLCFAQRLSNFDYKALLVRAKQLETNSEIEYAKFAKTLNRFNPHFINQIHRL